MSPNLEARSPLRVWTEIALYSEDSSGLWEATCGKLENIAAVRADVHDESCDRRPKLLTGAAVGLCREGAGGSRLRLAELKLIFDEREDVLCLAAAWSCAHAASEAKIAT
ncbi:hypothetical protein DL771_002583 [Monosporascus sp. 5C6A]|nr:hypothetical protein DL771_002583 [Monosporascus sp. 5C6A]